MLMSTLSPLFRQENKGNEMALEAGVTQQDVLVTSMGSKRGEELLWLRPSRHSRGWSWVVKPDYIL